MTILFDKQAIAMIRDYMIQHHETIAIAESVTSGLIQAALASAANASLFYQGGITAYNLGQKYRHLLVDPIHATSCNSVSQRVANDMALNVCELFNSDWGIGITGYASPVPESGDRLFTYYAVATGKKIVIARRLDFDAADPIAAQQYYIQQLLNDLHIYLERITSI